MTDFDIFLTLFSPNIHQPNSTATHIKVSIASHETFFLERHSSVLKLFKISLKRF